MSARPVPAGRRASRRPRPVAVLGALALLAAPLSGCAALGGSTSVPTLVDPTRGADPPFEGEWAEPTFPEESPSPGGAVPRPSSTWTWPFGDVAASPPASPSPLPPSCPPPFRPGTVVPLDGTVEGGSLVVTWRHNGDPAVLGYRVGVQPQVWVRDGDELTMPPIVWTPVAAPSGCTPVRHVATAARSGVAYVVWLEADVTTPEITPSTSRIAVGRVAVRAS